MQDPFESPPPQRAQHRGHMPVRQTPFNGERLGRLNDRLAPQHPAQGLDLARRPMGQVRQRAIFDLARLAVALTKQYRRRGGPIGNGVHEHAHIMRTKGEKSS